MNTRECSDNTDSKIFELILKETYLKNTLQE